MGKADTLVFDKTGTLTYGKPAVCDVLPLAEGMTAEELLTLTASAEQKSEHPLGRAVTDAAQKQGFPLSECGEFRMEVGRGIHGNVGGRALLCGTEAFLPNGRGETPYPKFVDEYKKIKPIGVIIILTCLMTLGALLNIIIDLRISLAVTWSGYSVGGILLLYITVVLPMWFTRPNPVIFVPCDFAAATLYLLYVNLSTGGKWFLTLAFPAIGAAALIVTAVIALTRYLKRGFLYI
jgi:hypothetical protein